MNTFLKTLLDTIGIDVGHLKTEYLSEEELRHLDGALKSLEDFDSSFYSCDNGDNLEVLLQFLSVHREDIIALLEDNSEKEILICLYTSGVISGSYDCFRFDLSKFPKQYKPKNQVLTLYRIGRIDESENNLGCSWSKSIDGLKAFIQSSTMSVDIFNKRPIFKVEIDDSEVLFEGSSEEQELVLKVGFKNKTLRKLDDENEIISNLRSACETVFE